MIKGDNVLKVKSLGKQAFDKLQRFVLERAIFYGSETELGEDGKIPDEGKKNGNTAYDYNKALDSYKEIFR